MTLLWAVPVVAAAVGTLLVVARARTLEDEVVGLVADVRDLRAVREPLRSIRAMTAETDTLVAAFRDTHPLDDEIVVGAEDPVTERESRERPGTP